MSKNMLDGGQVIVDYLVREKVPYVFGLCGHGNIGFLDALYERSDEIKTVSVHHESVAGQRAWGSCRPTGSRARRKAAPRLGAWSRSATSAGPAPRRTRISESVSRRHARRAVKLAQTA